jgi:Cu+-exporting ATPase
MKVDRHKAVAKEFEGETYYFCSPHCLHAFESDPGRYRDVPAAAEDGRVAHVHQ